jgi:hypothetical protein
MSLIDEVGDRILVDKMLGKDKEDDEGEKNEQENPLSLTWNLLKRYIKNVCNFKGGKIEEFDDYKKIQELLEWVFSNWRICKDFTSRKKVFDLCNQGGGVSSEN